MKLSDVLDLFDERSSVTLATVAGDRPSVRPMTLMKVDGGLFMLTEAGSPKLAELRANPRCLVYRGLADGRGNGFITLDCAAAEETSPSERKRLYARSGYASTYWTSPGDPKFCLLRLVPDGARMMMPGEDFAVAAD
ncbi:MAG: pyridoxamine 5'-phosphate oxidase family protein [Candidatus Fermentibacter sp.]|nr:pyridoxamine 5'-phosphate oxidase family protein [Candidatus Fermentibacter sp.]